MKERNVGQRRSLKDEVADIDQQILRLLLKRHNLLEKMRDKGRIDPGEERFLREAWQNDVARVSRDPELSGRFFSLLQNVTFLPKPGPAEENTPGARRRDSFNLAPARKPCTINLTAPKDSRVCRFWLYLAACSGQAIRLGPATQSDAIVECIQAFNQMGASISRDGEFIVARSYAPMDCPDKVFYAGNSDLDLYLYMAHYAGRFSRAKFSGDTRLKMLDLSILHSTMQELGCRMIHIVPKTQGLPVRLECSGILPPAIAPDSSLPGDFIEALLLAAPFYTQPIGIDLRNRQDWQELLDHILPLLENCGVTFTLADKAINIQPSPVAIPDQPKIGADPVITTFLLAFSAPNGGYVRLKGAWPQWQETDALWKLLLSAGLDWEKGNQEIIARQQKPIKDFQLANCPPDLLERLHSRYIPLLTSLCACAALNGGQASLPEHMIQMPTVIDFLHMAGLGNEGLAIKRDLTLPMGLPWNAPTPSWAMAYALAACSRPMDARFSLGNPGIITELWPSFWAFYNSLPEPALKRQATPEKTEVKRRRILTDAIATPPEIRED